MARLIDYGAQLDRIRRVAERLTVRAQGPMDALRILWMWVRDNVEFELDADAARRTGKDFSVSLASDTELIRSAEITLDEKRGDCDCQSVLLGALIASLDLAPLAILLAKADEYRHDFSHVLLAAEIDGEWIPLETLDPDLPIGVLTNDVREGELIPLDLESGLGGFFRNPFRGVERFARNSAGELVNAVGDIVDSAGNVVRAVGRAGESIESQIARGVSANSLIDSAGNIIEIVLIDPAKAVGNLVDVDWDGGAFGLPSVKVDRRAMTVIGGMLVGIPPWIMVPIAASPANAYLWEAKDKLNQQSMRVFGAPIIPTNIPDYMKQVRFVGENIPLPFGLNDYLVEAAELYEMGRELEHFHRALRALDDNKILIEQSDVLDPGEIFEPEGFADPKTDPVMEPQAGSSWLVPGLIGVAVVGGALALMKAKR